MKKKEWKVVSPNAVELVVTDKEWCMLKELRKKDTNAAGAQLKEHFDILGELIETADEFEKPALEAERASSLKVYKLWLRGYNPVESSWMLAAKGTGRVLCAVGRATWNQVKAAKVKIGEEETAFRTSASTATNQEEDLVGEFAWVKNPITEMRQNDPSCPFGARIEEKI